MALNDIALCARALIRLGANPITSFDDGTVESDIANALYEPTRDSMLSSYPWSFALGQVQLTQLETDPIADFQYAYALPNDFLRAVSVGSNGRGRGAHYRIARNVIHCDVPDVTLTYLFRPEEEEFPPFFDMALITRLSAEFCVPVTENTSRAKALYDLAKQEFARARQIDGQQESPNRIENFNLIDVRG